MTLRKGIGVLVLLTSWLGIQAQDQNDALRYSKLSPIGTARYSAVGGAFGALGGDFTTLATNPAGIAIYRKAEFTFTPSVVAASAASKYNGSSAEDWKLNFNFANAGFVATRISRKATTRGWLSTNFGIGYTRTNSFHSRQLIEGQNNSSSLADIFVSQANGIHYEDLYAEHPFGAYLAWETFLIDTIPGYVDEYASALSKYGQTQRLEQTTRGSMGEVNLSFGANYSNRLYLGATIGFPNIKYDQSWQYSERDDYDSIPNFTSFEYNQNLSTRGNGYNFKIGMIYRAADWLRLGAAVHTPTFFQMQDTWDSDMSTTAYGIPQGKPSEEIGLFDYELTTPFRAIGSMAILFGKMGFISADYEHIDYSKSRLRSISSTNVFIAENETIRNTYKSVGNLRVGTEWRYNVVSFRSGCQFLGDPFKPDINIDNPVYSLGIGVRDRGFSVDVTYMLKKTSGDVYLYDPAYVSPASVNDQESTVLLTFGFRY